LDLGLQGKVVAVAAASKGLGLATAQAFAAEGAILAICSRDETAIETAAAAIGGEVLALACDLTAAGECERFISAAADRFGRLDVVVSNSGGPPPGDVIELTDDQFREAFELNALVHIRLARAALPHLRAHGEGGRILMITSAAVKQPIDGLGLSNTARTGLTGYAKTLSNRLAAEAITVNTVAPGMHDTERLRELAGGASTELLTGDIPARRLGTPEEFAAIVCFLASRQAAYVTGQTILVDGGRTKGLL
jgi:3-oxoacyl-[acyl-carrier protein] reductase